MIKHQIFSFFFTLLVIFTTSCSEEDIQLDETDGTPVTLIYEGKEFQEFTKSSQDEPINIFDKPIDELHNQEIRDLLSREGFGIHNNLDEPNVFYLFDSFDEMQEHLNIKIEPGSENSKTNITFPGSPVPGFTYTPATGSSRFTQAEVTLYNFQGGVGIPGFFGFEGYFFDNWRCNNLSVLGWNNLIRSLRITMLPGNSTTVSVYVSLAVNTNMGGAWIQFEMRPHPGTSAGSRLIGHLPSTYDATASSMNVFFGSQGSGDRSGPGF